MICCVIPAYKARRTVCDVVRGVLPHVDLVLVVDDACPEHTGAAVSSTFRGHPSVAVLTRERNGGVGAATKDGIAHALEVGADVIVKLDADGQMDPAYIPRLAEMLLRDPHLALVKGNRFFDPLVIREMPVPRLLGNSSLSLLTKFSSGFWDVLDPTNGYLAFNAAILRNLSWREFSDDYLFEISALCELGLKRGQMAEVQMATIYNASPSSLSIPRVLFSFPPRLFRLFFRRIALQYFLFDVNLGSLYITFGALLCLFGVSLLSLEWAQSLITHVPRTTGTVMLGVLPSLMGFQLLLNALLYDVQFSPKLRRDLLEIPAKPGKDRRSVGRPRQGAGIP